VDFGPVRHPYSHLWAAAARSGRDLTQGARFNLVQNSNFANPRSSCFVGRFRELTNWLESHLHLPTLCLFLVAKKF